MGKVNVAVIGYGHLGKWHAQKANGLSTSNLVAIVEPFEAARSAAKEAYPHVKVVKDISEVMNEIDAAVIVTPTSTHFELTKTLLNNGKHVFCEKPLCNSFKEVKSLEGSLKDSLVLQVGHSERCHQAWELIRPELNKHTKHTMSVVLERVAAFKGRATDVDVVSDLMIHDVDLLLYLFDKKPKSVKAYGHKIRTQHWDHVTAIFSYADGPNAIVKASRNHVVEKRIFELTSSEGTLAVDLFANKYHVATNSQFEDGTYVQSHDYPKRDHLLVEQEAFYNAILNNLEPMVGYNAGAGVVYILDKIIESLNSGKEIELNLEL